MPKLKRPGDADNRGATDFIESLDRGLRVLEVFGGSRQPMTLSDLARAADLPRATARRILFTLERAGFVATDGKLFRLMPRVLVLASSYLASNHVVSVLQPALDRLSGEAQEISSMAILDGSDVVFIARASPTRIFSSGIDIGYRLPAFCTSVGRVLLSRLPDDELAAALDKMDLAAADAVHRHRQETVAKDDHRRSRERLFAGRSRSRAGFPLDLGTGPPLRRRHRRRHQHGRACRPRVVSRDGRTLFAAIARGGGLGQIDAGVTG